MLKASSRPNGIRPSSPRTSTAATNTTTARTVSTSLRRPLASGWRRKQALSGGGRGGTTTWVTGMSSGRSRGHRACAAGLDPPANEASSTMRRRRRRIDRIQTFATMSSVRFVDSTIDVGKHDDAAQCGSRLAGAAGVRSADRGLADNGCADVRVEEAVGPKSEERDKRTVLDKTFWPHESAILVLYLGARSSTRVWLTQVQDDPSDPLVLRALLADPMREMYSAEIGATAGLPSGTVHPILARFEGVQWFESAGRTSTPGRGPAGRRYYRLTAGGVEAARTALARTDRPRVRRRLRPVQQT